MLMKDASILIVDDDPDVLTAVRLLLKTEVKQVVTEKSPENLKYLLSQQPFDLILLDMNFNSSINTGNEGFFWLQKIKDYKSDAIVIMITAYGDIDLAVRSLKEGAADFVVEEDGLVAVLPGDAGVDEGLAAAEADRLQDEVDERQE